MELWSFYSRCVSCHTHVGRRGAELQHIAALSVPHPNILAVEQSNPLKGPTYGSIFLSPVSMSYKKQRVCQSGTCRQRLLGSDDGGNKKDGIIYGCQCILLSLRCRSTP